MKNLDSRNWGRSPKRKRTETDRNYIKKDSLVGLDIDALVELEDTGGVNIFILPP